MSKKEKALYYELLQAAKDLAAKLEEVRTDPQYISVWSIAANHGMIYNGPTYADELADLNGAIFDIEIHE